MYEFNYIANLAWCYRWLKGNILPYFSQYSSSSYERSCNLLANSLWFIYLYNISFFLIERSEFSIRR